MNVRMVICEFLFQAIKHASQSEIFKHRLKLLNERANLQPFMPKWKSDNDPNLRQTVFAKHVNLTKEFTDQEYPHVQLMPCWHGTSDAAAAGIVKAGFAALQTTDDGWFGKGLYFAAEAKYSFEQYAKKASGQVLLMCWASSFSVYPVIEGDMAKLQGKAQHGNYDAHFVPIKEGWSLRVSSGLVLMMFVQISSP